MDISKIQLENVVYDIKDQTARNSITEINNKLNSKDCYLILGDSYGTGFGGVKSFITFFKDYMNLDNEHLFYSSMNGIGFVNRPSGDKIFIELLQDLANTMTSEQKQKITKLIVQTGINDKAIQTSTLVTAIKNFYDYVKLTFPNAKMFIYPVGRSSKYSNNQNIISNCYPAYREVEKYGIINIKGSENILHQYNLFQNDTFHPTDNGERKIAEFLPQGIETGCVNPYYVSSSPLSNYFKPDGSATSYGVVNLVTNLYGDYVKIQTEDRVFIGLANISVSSGSDIVIGKLISHNSDLCCHPRTTNCLIPVTGFMVGKINGVYNENIQLNGTLYFIEDSNKELLIHLRFSKNTPSITESNGLQFDMFSGICNTIES
mgnify:CR=1 FL=1|jgi:hypothetical protein